MTGNTPQPGETPAGSPWARPEPEPGWWQGDTDRLPTSQEGADRKADDARAAGAGPARTAGAHDPTERLTTADELMIIEPGRPGPADEEPDRPVPELVVSPEPDDGTRPTVPLDPRRPPLPPLPEGGVSPATAGRLARVENSPFWAADEARIAAEARLDEGPGRRRRPPVTRPVTAMLSLIGLGLVAAFFGWVSAEPFWLAMGHGDRGYATTTSCHGDGLTQRCTGRFASSDGRITAGRVVLLGISGAAREPGAVSGARMVGPGSAQAYAAPPGLLMHLRWVLGFLLVLICGYGIAGATGARHLESPSARRTALLGSLAGPVLLLAGFLIAAY
ncbi:hypothetical protein [Actinoplanes siamensis]|uniref:Uncharacterized protein n=1 Tax=Actinoplanes siamensis TaxID=1223317 RepID=A0A919NDB0_9ACTN|nr:hypothetical protein [Actinoplanes siamensis]GIF08776.1 hypothetical protein Asi03nite_63140 [Actinoplanes siamensis]